MSGWEIDWGDLLVRLIRGVGNHFGTLGALALAFLVIPAAMKRRDAKRRQADEAARSAAGVRRYPSPDGRLVLELLPCETSTNETVRVPRVLDARGRVLFEPRGRHARSWDGSNHRFLENGHLLLHLVQAPAGAVRVKVELDPHRGRVTHDLSGAWVEEPAARLARRLGRMGPRL